MALTYTPENPEIGAEMPHFSLISTSGALISSEDFKNSQALLVMFICNHCPYVKAIMDRLIDLANEVSPVGVGVVGISSNDALKYPEDSLVKMQELVQEKKIPFFYLFDESQEVARQFGAVCTPDFFLFDRHRKLAYRGRLDDSWKEPSQVKERSLYLAIQSVMTGKNYPSQQIPSMGCSIKWK